MKSFSGRVVVITGAGSGIGRALAVEFAGLGARLALSDVDGERVASTVDLCSALGAFSRGYALDVADRAAVLAHADEVVGDFGGVNVVVNNAGVAQMGTVADTTWDDLDWIVGVNFWGVVHGTKAFLPHLIASGDGHVVNLSSVFGLIGVPTQSAYNATKFAVRGYTEALRQEMILGKHRVGVSCVHPGGIQTNIARDARSADLDAAQRDKGFQRIARTTPESAARTIISGIERNKARILIGADAHVIDPAVRLLGSGYQRVLTSGAKVARRFGIDL